MGGGRGSSDGEQTACCITKLASLVVVARLCSYHVCFVTIVD